MTTPRYLLADLSKADKAAALKHVAYMGAEFGVVSVVAQLPDLGTVTITTNGDVYKKTYA